MKFYVKVWVGLGISYLIIILFSDIFFIGKSPLLRVHPEQYFAKKIQSQVNGVLVALNVKRQGSSNSGITADDYRNFMSTAAAKGMQQVTTGTYAANINGEDVRIIKLGEKLMDSCPYMTPQGQKIIHVLKGKSCPPQSEVEGMFR